MEISNKLIKKNTYRTRTRTRHSEDINIKILKKVNSVLNNEREIPFF